MSEVSPPDAWVEAAAAHICDAINRAAVEAEDGVARVAVAGGSTPAPVYRRMAALRAVDWSRVDIYFGDERCVPPDHPESNYRMVLENLVVPGGIDPARVVRMEGERDDPDVVATDYARLLPAPLPVLLLGIGEDGHTASLFPGAPALAEEARRVVPVEATDERLARLTITPSVIARAGRVLVLARGERKADAVARALHGAWDPCRCPAQLARHGTWLVDPAAATGLRPGPTTPSDPRTPSRA